MIIAFLALGCSGNDTDRRSQKQEERLNLLHDSLHSTSFNYQHVCDSLLNVCQLDIDRYEIETMKAVRFQLENQLDSVLHHALRLQSFARTLPPTPRSNSLLAHSLSLEANYYHIQRRENQKAIDLYTESYHRIMESDNIQKAPDIAANLADAYTYVDNMPQAARWYRRSLVLADSLQLPAEQTVSLNMGIARIYTQMGDYATAERYYKQTERQIDDLEPNMQSYYLNNFGNLYYYKGDHANAIKMFRRLKQHLESINASESFEMYLCKLNMADVFLNLHQDDSAAIYVNSVDTFFRANKVEPAIYYINTIRIGLALRNGQKAEAGQILASEHFTEDIEQSIKDIRSKYLEKYYVITGDYRKAYENVNNRLAENDSLLHNKMNMRTIEIMQRLTEDTLRMHHQLEVQEHNETIEDFSYAMVIFILLCTIMLCIILYNRRKQTANEMNLLKLKLENARNRISPHFIYNILNTEIETDENKHDIARNSKLVNLSKLIRLNLDLASNLFVSIDDEIDFVKQYVELQRSLIEGELVFTLNISPKVDTSCTMIPSMFIQILVENSFKHGLKQIKGEKRLTVNIMQNNDNETYISVEDNGKGFDACRNNDTRSHNGLKIITQTILAINRRNKKHTHMRFEVKNLHADDNTICGCRATIVVPKNIKTINQ